MSTGYEVDLSYLQATVTKLQGVVDGMDGVGCTVTYQTNLTQKQIGGDGFQEAAALYSAHEHMKTQINGMITTLKSMIQEFQTKTGNAHKAYAAQESQTSTNFNGGMAS
jgi:hypothetical protein